MKAALLKIGKPLEVVDINDDLDEFYSLLEVDTIDIVSRSVGTMFYDIICDDNGLLVENPRIALVPTEDDERNFAIYGNIIFCNYNDEGKMIDLTDSEIQNLKNHQVVVSMYGEDYPAITIS